MNFEFSDDQLLLKDQVRKFMDECCPSSEVREVLDGHQPYNKKVWQGVGDMGLLGTAIPEAYGGSGAGYLELCVVAEELGRAVAPIPFSSSIFLAAEAILFAGSEDQKQKYLPRLAAGDCIGTLAVSEGVGNPHPGGIQVAFGADRLTGTKTPVPEGSYADLAIVLAKEPEGLSLVIADLGRSGVVRDTVTTVDPSRDMASLTFESLPAERLGVAGQGWDLLQTIYNRAAVLFAFEQLGGAQQALEAATAYAKDRFAFGRPIGSFQAIKHMLADMYVDLELARSNCYYGAWALATEAAELPEAAATARVSATTAYQHCAKNNIQVHGGMGFTWEFDCHLHYRRSNLLAVIVGSQSEWEDKLISRLENRNAPAAA